MCRLLADQHRPVVIIAEFIDFDCQKHTITGDGTGNGITIRGRTGVRVENCIVTNFENGFLMTETSRNRIQNHTVTKNRGNGFLLRSAQRNLFISGIADGAVTFLVTENGRDGFDLELSNGNYFDGVTVSRNGRNGFTLSDSDNGVFHANEVDDNGFGAAGAPGSGFGLLRATGNTLLLNFAVHNAQNGFRLAGSSENTLDHNTSCRSASGVDAVQEGASRLNWWFRNNLENSGNLGPLVEPGGTPISNIPACQPR
jgi:parallel beta-helix repeat protein